MMYLVLILGLFLLALAVTMVIRALSAPAGPSTETIEQIGAYGFAGSLPTSAAGEPRKSLRSHFDDIAGHGGTVARPALHPPARQGLPSAPRVCGACTPGRPTGCSGRRRSRRSALSFLMLWLSKLAGAGSALLLLIVVGTAVVGWVLPMFVVNSRHDSAASRSSAAFPT